MLSRMVEMFPRLVVLLASINGFLVFPTKGNLSHRAPLAPEKATYNMFDTSKFVEHQKCANDSLILYQLLNKTGFSKHRIPNPYGAVDVKLEIWVQEITSLSQKDGFFEMDIYINEFWVDSNLNFEDMDPCKKNMTLTSNFLKSIWSPNSCFIDSKLAVIHNSPFSNIFILLFANGTIWANYRVQIKGPCKMDFTNFPMDEHTCYLTYESFMYNHDEVHLDWKPLQVYTLHLPRLPEFTLINISSVKQFVKYPPGVWDDLKVTFTFQRRVIWYFLQCYLPTYFTVFISWISFSLGWKAIPARTTLGVSTLLSMILMFSNIMKDLPKVPYVKAIDVWMLVCQIMIFLSLVELAIVGYVTKKMEMTKPANVRKVNQHLIDDPLIEGLAYQNGKLYAKRSNITLRVPHHFFALQHCLLGLLPVPQDSGSRISLLSLYLEGVYGFGMTCFVIRIPWFGIR